VTLAATFLETLFSPLKKVKWPLKGVIIVIIDESTPYTDPDYQTFGTWGEDFLVYAPPPPGGVMHALIYQQDVFGGPVPATIHTFQAAIHPFLPFTFLVSVWESLGGGDVYLRIDNSGSMTEANVDIAGFSAFMDAYHPGRFKGHVPFFGERWLLQFYTP
jgi:hypothetical protein